MWPSKKKDKKEGKKENKKISLAPGESMEIGFTVAWRADKNEVAIMTDDGPIVLDEKSELFIEIKADNIDPIKAQIIPDFKNKTINLVEVIDPNAERKFADKDAPRLAFSGHVVREVGMSLGDYLKNWDENMERYEKLVKRSKLTRNIFIPVQTILLLYNLYMFITKTDMMRYLNLAVVFLSIFIVYYAWNSHRKLYKDYKRYKELRDEAFTVVKNT